MIVLLKNSKRVWIDNLTDRNTLHEIEGVLLSEFVPNKDFRYAFYWCDVVEVLCEGKKNPFVV